MAVLTLLSLHSSDCFSQLFPIDLGGEKWQFLEGFATSGFQNGYFRFIINMTWMWKWAYLTHLWVFPKHFHTGFMLFTTLGNDLAQKIKIIKKLWQYQYYTLNIVISYAKYFLYSVKIKEGRLDMNLFKHSLEHTSHIENYISVKKNTFMLLLDEWQNVILWFFFHVCYHCLLYLFALNKILKEKKSFPELCMLDLLMPPTGGCRHFLQCFCECQ